MSYKSDAVINFNAWTCKECGYVNKRYLLCGRYVYGNRDETKCVFCGADKSNSDDYKGGDEAVKFDAEKEKEFQAIIEKQKKQMTRNNKSYKITDKFVDGERIIPEKKSYLDDEDYVNPSYDLNPPSPTFKAECVETERFTEKEFNIILLKAKSIKQNKDIIDKYKAKSGAGINVDIKKGDSMGIEHIFAILLYIHCPSYVSKYRVSLPSKFYYFYKFLYEAVTYFGEKMPADMVVYAGLTGGLNVKEDKKDDDDDDNKDKNKDPDDDDRNFNDQFTFLNTTFLVIPFSATRDAAIFDKDIVVISLKATFLGDFNDTKYLDLAAFSSFSEKEGKNEVVFLGEFCELQFMDIKVQGDDTCKFSDYIMALKYWQKFTSGFADFNAKKYNMEFLPNDKVQKCLLQILKGDKEVPKYIQQLFSYYNENKTGEKYHRMYDELLDIDFSKICKKVTGGLNKEIKELLFNEDESDVDKAKIKKFFTKGKKYVDVLEKQKDF